MSSSKLLFRIFLLVIPLAVLMYGCGSGTSDSVTPAETGQVASMDALDSLVQTASDNLADYHVMVIVLDSLRADHLGCYGYHRPTSPFIDRLADTGVVFDRAQSNSSYTLESVASLFSGQFPSRHAWGTGWHSRPNPDQPTLAEHFQSAGYATGLFSNTPGLNYPGFFRGFETTKFVGDFGQSGMAPQLFEQVIEFTRGNLDARRFTYLHILDPHSPYEPPEEYYHRFAETPLPPDQRVEIWQDLRTNLPALVEEGFGPGEARFECMVSRYDAEIAFVDAHLKILFDKLHDLGALQNTLVIFTADHGEEFLDHGYVEHAWRLYWESLHIPLIFWAPGLFAPQRIQERVSLVDIKPTLLTLFEMSFAPERTDGSALFIQKDDKWAFQSHNNPIIAELGLQTRNIGRIIQHQEHAYLAFQRWLDIRACTDIWSNEVELRREFAIGKVRPMNVLGPVTYEAFYNTEVDIAQHDNLIGRISETDLEPFREMSQKYLQECPPQLSDRERILIEMGQMPPERIERMEAIGYLSNPTDTLGEMSPDLIQQIEALGYLL